jgi:hypothetical protein
LSCFIIIMSNKVNVFLDLAHLHFLNLFFSPNRACGPEVPPLAGLRGKSIGGERIPSGDPPWLPQNGAGRSGARPGAPTSENPSSRRKIGLPALYHASYRARPGQGMKWKVGKLSRRYFPGPMASRGDSLFSTSHFIFPQSEIIIGLLPLKP